MTKRKQSILSGWGDYVTSTISVMLVIFILGLTGVTNVTFDGISRELKQRVGFSVLLSDSISSSEISQIRQMCLDSRYISKFRIMTADQVLKDQTADEGEDLVALLGVNPYSPMIEVNLRARYANLDSINRIIGEWEKIPAVEEISANTELVDNLNRNASILNVVLIVIAAVLLFISFVLINNTVRLTVYSRRFLIHTMKLVGAKASFIRAPFLKMNGLQGLIAGLLAAGILWGLVCWIQTLDEAVGKVLDWQTLCWIFAAMPLLGVLICEIAVWLATNRYLKMDYDKLF